MANAEETHGSYCTALFNHGKNPSGKTSKYEFTVQIEAETVGRPKKPQFVRSERYSVLKQSTMTHVVEFKKHNERGLVYGYVVFPLAASKEVELGEEGPIESVKQQSIIMAEETTNPKGLYISVKSPQLKLEPKKQSPAWCKAGTTEPSRSDDVDETLLYCSKSADQSVHVNLREPAKWTKLESLHVGGKDKSSSLSNYLDPAGAPNKKLLKFIKLKNGAETEVAFR